MKSFLVALWAETLKVRKSGIFLVTILFFVFVSCMMGLIMFIQMHPEISDKLGLIGNKASMMRFGTPNWQNYFNLLLQGIAGVGLVGIGFVASWVFGREFSDHTSKDILVVPVSRTNIVLSKSVVVVIWSILLSIVYFVSAFILGFVIGLPGYSSNIIIHGGYLYSVTVSLSVLLFSPVAFFASYSRGYIFPIGFVILTLILANFSGLVGLGPYFPWAIPGLFGMSSASACMQLNLSSYIILVLTSLLGLFGTVAFWRYADQK